MPTICFYEPEIYFFRKVAQTHINALERIGVLHQSPESAADKVKEVAQNPQEWWCTEEVQEIRRAFVQRYARLEDGWIEAWKEEFSRVEREL